MSRYPPIADYALIGDCHTAALVSRQGSIDWCCLPRFDSDSCFGRLLDWRLGGHFSIEPCAKYESEREYLQDSLILITRFRTRNAEVRVTDFFAMRPGGRERPRRELIRIVDGVRGHMRLNIAVVPRLDFGAVKPWIRQVAGSAFIAVGSNTGLEIFGDVPLKMVGKHDLHATMSIAAGKRHHVAIRFAPPESAQVEEGEIRDGVELNAHLKETRRWWNNWASKMKVRDKGRASICRSAIVLKALTFAPTGAIIAAPTTSLPEEAGGARNWDYRFSWVRDSVFTVRALADLGFHAEADGFRRFVQRSAAGNADELQVLYGVDGKRRLTEVNLTHLEGWRKSAPVRVGNGAESQFQSDVYGLLLELAWRWSERGNSPAPHYWRFLAELVEAAIANWSKPDRGIWEIRSRPRHFVHSKVMCWAAVDRGVALAEKHGLEAPLQRWRQAGRTMRHTIERRGVDRKRGIFVESFGSREVDAALLLLPTVGFVAWDDPRMIRTADVIRMTLADDGLIRRYDTVDGLRGQEGVFLACTFWLAECLARQGRLAEAERAFRSACECSNDVGLFAEEYAPRARQMLGNFPQGLTHLAHISAALALGADNWQHEQSVTRGDRRPEETLPDS